MEVEFKQTYDYFNARYAGWKPLVFTTVWQFRKMVAMRFFFELIGAAFEFSIPFFTKRSIDYIQNWEEDQLQADYFGLTLQGWHIIISLFLVNCFQHLKGQQERLNWTGVEAKANYCMGSMVYSKLSTVSLAGMEL